MYMQGSEKFTFCTLLVSFITKIFINLSLEEKNDNRFITELSGIRVYCSTCYIRKKGVKILFWNSQGSSISGINEPTGS